MSGVVNPKVISFQFGNEQELALFSSRFESIPNKSKRTIDLGDEVSNHNLHMLIKRKSGERYKVDEATGKLIKGSRFSGSAGVTEALAKLIKKIDAYVQGKDRNDKALRVFLQCLFAKDGKIGHLSKNLYSRDQLNNTTLAKFLRPDHTVKVTFGPGRTLFYTSSKLEEVEESLDLSLGSDELNHNFWHLLKRNEKDAIDITDTGRLVKGKRSWIERRDPVKEQMIKRKIATVIEVLEKRVPALDKRVSTLVLRGYFLDGGPLSRLTQSQFDRTWIKPESALEELLASDFTPLRAALQEVIIQGDSYEKQLIDLTKAQLNYALSLNVELKKITVGGSGGPRVGFDCAGNKILVVKPGDEGPYGENNTELLSRLKRFFLSPKMCLRGNSEPIAEVDAYDFDRAQGIKLVPPTATANVRSKTFNGTDRKECSVQMFVAGTQTLKEYLGIPGWVQMLPRPLQRRYFKKHEQEYITKLPRSLLEKLAFSNFLVEDIDCHLDNVLVKVTPPHQPLDELPQGEKETAQFVRNLFNGTNFQRLLMGCFATATLDDGTRISLIKHDGGAGLPHTHPRSFDLLSLRNKHLFETLPAFEQPWASIDKNENAFIDSLVDKAKRSLENVIYPHFLFEEFWKVAEVKWLATWLFGATREERIAAERQMVRYLVAERNRLSIDPSTMSAIEQEEIRRNNFEHFNYHLHRIMKSIETRIDSWVVLDYYKDQPMRKTLLVQTGRDFAKIVNKEHQTFHLALRQRALKRIQWDEERLKRYLQANPNKTEQMLQHEVASWIQLCWAVLRAKTLIPTLNLLAANKPEIVVGCARLNNTDGYKQILQKARGWIKVN